MLTEPAGRAALDVVLRELEAERLRPVPPPGIGWYDTAEVCAARRAVLEHEFLAFEREHEGLWGRHLRAVS